MTGGEGNWQREVPEARQLRWCPEWGRASHFPALEGAQEASMSKEAWAEGWMRVGQEAYLCGSVKGQLG